MEKFRNLDGAVIVLRMIEIIHENKQYLSDIDGAIGDGDHGVNMNKGFNLTGEALLKEPGDLSHSMNTLAKILMMRIGGAMGPLFGKIFKTMGKVLAGHEWIDAELFRQALEEVREGMTILSPARPGDKTLVDALYPAIDAFRKSMDKGGDFRASLQAMKRAAEEGRDATREMVARIGRSSRLGDRSRGVVDAGAASCALLLGSMADTMTELLCN
jgi:dihydroxyacetone kinase-like protein